MIIQPTFFVWCICIEEWFNWIYSMSFVQITNFRWPKVQFVNEELHPFWPGIMCLYEIPCVCDFIFFLYWYICVFTIFFITLINKSNSLLRNFVAFNFVHIKEVLALNFWIILLRCNIGFKSIVSNCLSKWIMFFYCWVVSCFFNFALRAFF